MTSSPSQRLKVARIATDAVLSAIQQDITAAREAFHADRSTEALARLNRASIKLQALLSHTG